MSLYNDLTSILTPYANKIKQNESDIDDIQDALEHLDVDTDKTLSIEGKPADAKVVGDALFGAVGQIAKANELLFLSDCDIDGVFSIGGIQTPTGKTASNTKRVRMGYTTVRANTSYCLSLNNDNYFIVNAWTYTSNTESSASENLTDFIVDGRLFVFSVANDPMYLRLSVKHRSAELDMTDSDVAAISNAIELHELTDLSLSKKGVPADSYHVGREVTTIKEFLPSYDFNWKRLSIESAPLGWGIGYYNVDTGVGNSSSKNYMRTYVNKIDVDVVSPDTIMCAITPPSGYYVLVSVSNKSDNSFVETLNYNRAVDKTIEFRFDKTKRYSFTIGGFSEDSDLYLTESFLESIILRIYRKSSAEIGVYKTNDKTSEYIYNSEFEYALALPDLYEPVGNPTKMIICCHGLSSTISASNWGSKNVSLKFVEQGYAVMDVNQVTSQDWCNPALIRKYVVALNHIVNNYNVIPKFVYGYSMGSLVGLALSTIVSGIKACVISGIRLDFEARYNALSAEEKSVVDNNFDFTDGFDYYKTSGWCKTAYACLTGDNELVNPVQFPPTRFLWGTSDTLTLSESLTKIEQIKRGGTVCDDISYEGGTHGAMCLLTAGSSFNDAVNWFDTWL